MVVTLPDEPLQIGDRVYLSADRHMQTGTVMESSVEGDDMHRILWDDGGETWQARNDLTKISPGS